MADLDRALARVARDQLMLISYADVMRAGGAAHHIRARVRSGRWEEVEHHVYLIAGAPLGWHVRAQAAVLAAGPDAVATAFAAGRVWGFIGCATAVPEVTVPRGRTFRRTRIRVHESTDLHLCRIVMRDGVRVTDPDRTILDLARYVGVRQLTRIIESARRAGLVTWSSLIACLAAHARRGRPGIRRLRAVIAAEAGREEITDTDVEMLLLATLRAAGLPEPVVHLRIERDGRFVAEVDLGYPQWRIAIEADGSIHGLDEVRDRDAARQNDLVLAGWIVLRFTNERILRRPDLVVAEVRRAIEAAKERAAREPAA